MANTSNVSYAKPKVGGAVYIGATNATMPTDGKATLTGFTSLGYISEDGLTNSNTPSSETVKAWGGDTVLTLSTEREDTFSFTLIEGLNTEVLKLVYNDDNVTGSSLSTGITVSAKNDAMKEHSFVIDMVLADSVLKRIVIPKAVVTEVSDISYKDNEAIGYSVTITALAGSDGVTHKEFIVK